MCNISLKKFIFSILSIITSVLLLIIILPLLGRISFFNLDGMRCMESNIFGRNCYIHGIFLFLLVSGVSILLIWMVWLLKTYYINRIVRIRELSLDYDGQSEETSSDNSQENISNLDIVEIVEIRN